MRPLTCLALAACCLSAPALAQSTSAGGQLPSPEDIAKRDSVTLGVGAAITPDYEGSDDYRFIPAAAIRGRVSGISFTTRGTYLFVDLVPKKGDKVEFNAGPIVGVRLTTYRHIHDDVVEMLPKRKRAIEVGGYAGVSVHGVTNPYDSLGFRVDVTHDIGGAHKSTIVSPNVEFSTPLSRSTYASLNGGMDFVSNKFADYYFSNSEIDDVHGIGNVLLPAYNAGGGLKSWKVGLLLNQSLTGDLLHGFSIFGVGQYSRLVGDFKRAPIVAQRGSASQWLGAVGLAYTW